ncbi:hypothetical protein QCA50_005716 [Cerrena zonata]|uniref:RNA polymerase subunit H/Rpb5 C-terminal domain-containing protein n=1 Tax=Cerrena zonata TaxID=2478898 RepID=A0AAW0GFY2_9APHY
MDLGNFRSHYSNSAGSVDCMQEEMMFDRVSQSGPTEFLHQPQGQPNGPNLCILHGREECRCQDDAKLLGILEEKNIQRGIIVFPGNMTPSARKVIVAMAQQYKLEEFSESDLLVNITHHTLVPKHEVLTAEQKKTLLEKYRLKETQLPRIQLADPVARYYGLRRGKRCKNYSTE